LLPNQYLLHQPELINQVGHASGALIFGLFLYLLWRDRAENSRLPVAAAALAFLWDALALAILLLPPRDWPLGARVLSSLSFAALSLLPAVLLDLSLGQRRGLLVRTGYVVSLAAVALHAMEMADPARHWHERALWLVTLGFAALTIVAGVRLVRERGGVIGTMALFLLALSLTHLADWPSNHDWRFELLLHHASIPIALYVLLTGYRFLLLDAFVRILANFALAVGVVAAAAALVRAFPLGERALWVGGCLVLVLFGALRTRVERLLTRALFPPADLAGALTRLRELEGEGFWTNAQKLVADLMRAEVAPDPQGAIREQLNARQIRYPTLIADPAWARGVQAAVPMRLSNGETHWGLLGRRQGGRRYVSADLESIERLTAAIVERAEQLRTVEMQRLVAEAELQALEAQIHPHFLFNALNTLYGVIPRESGDARRLVLNLSDILRYFLKTGKTLIPLEEEMRIVRAYLEIEQLRMGGKLAASIEVDPGLEREPIPILSIEPLVENAVKHGVASRSTPGAVRIRVRSTPSGMAVEVGDTGPGFTAARADSQRGAGMGLANVARRLKLCYGEQAELRIDSTADGTRVAFDVPLAPSAEAA
jgi:hypothetical protein